GRLDRSVVRLCAKGVAARFRHIALFPSSDRHMASARGPHGRSDCPKNPMKREPVGIVVDVGCGDVAERYAGGKPPCGARYTSTIMHLRKILLPAQRSEKPRIQVRSGRDAALYRKTRAKFS
ncbi:hypothetical protein, partial [Pseudomonas aeruginosa]|uniref:hypothetical protein n=1 Tax=Pseudomonas aeruginosa TaxID=287 RepID=UPI001C3F80C1